MSNSDPSLVTTDGVPVVDVLIVGAGLAGLYLALKLAPRSCIVLSPAPLGHAASSAWAQGGLAAALSPEDSAEVHAADTVAAGDGLVDPVIARLVAEDGPARVRDLLELGVPFDRTPDGALALSLEAAHSHPRVARVAGDLAGRAIMGALCAAVEAAPQITVLEGHKALALLQGSTGRIGGVVARDGAGRLQALAARETVLCTGGTGGLYKVTTNPVEARGDALAMAYDSGALIADPEFVQFHPTAIDIGRDPAPLATEALRGEGAVLTDDAGVPFMGRYDPAGDLAPRDRVARGVHAEILAGRKPFLDARDAVGAAFPEHFPTVFKTCESAGIDPRSDLIPVAPAAHYHMGGIFTDLWGRTTLAGLSACGECASTGIHGANRLASNSLLEAVVFATRIAERISGEDLKAPKEAMGRPPVDLPPDALQGLRQLMFEACGVVRTGDRLREALASIHALGEGHEVLPRGVRAAELMVFGALAREESRGGHYREDHARAAPEAARTFLARGDDGPLMMSQKRSDGDD